MSTELPPVREVHVGDGAVRALEGVSIHVDEGEVVSVIGSNGAGKTGLTRLKKAPERRTFEKWRNEKS